MQLEAYLERDDRIVLPLGSTEQHAYLSLATDVILAERVAVEAAEPLRVPVLPPLAFGVAPSGGVGDEWKQNVEALEDQARVLCGDALSAALAAGVDAEVALVAQRPHAALLSLADERDARYIVVGGWGESPIRGAILGSTPHKLLHLSERPVLVVPGT